MISENTAETPEVPQEQQSFGLEDLADLLSVADTDNTESNASESEPAPTASEQTGEKAELKTFNDLAERLGVEVSDLYGVEIARGGNEEPATIGELKDFFAEREEFGLRELAFNERMVTEEAKIQKAQDELREIMSALPERALKPDAVEKMRERREARLVVEKQKTLEAIPEWRNDATRTQDIAGMSEHLQQYGYPVNFLASVSDHRQMKYFRDNWRRESALRKALAKIRLGRPNPTTAGKPAAAAPKKAASAQPAANARDPLQAVFSNL